jgi:uncharacterized protein DUF3159
VSEEAPPSERTAGRHAASPLARAKAAENADFRALLIQSIGGWRGMVDSGLPVVVFVLANVIGGLKVGIFSAIGAAVLLILIRLVRKETVQQAISGAFGVAIAAFIAWRMGQARGFFLLGIWRNVIYGAIFAISVLVRRPLVGVLWEYLEGNGQAWRQDRKLRRTYYAVTILWAAVFFARAIVQEFFYQRNATGWLAGTSLAMGYPLFGLALAITVLAVRQAGRDAKAARKTEES